MERIFTREPSAEDAPHLQQDHEWLLANLHEHDVQAMLFGAVLNHIRGAERAAMLIEAGAITPSDEDRKVVDGVKAFAKRLAKFQKSHWPEEEKDPLQCT